MPALLDLSNELLFKIIDQIHPDDVPHFSLTCKDIHHVAKEAVELHLEREETYEDVVLDGCHRHKDNDHPVDFIKELCMDWRIGQYVKTLTVNCCAPPVNPDWFPEEEDKEDTRKYEVEKRDDNIITRAVMPAIMGSIKEKAPEWTLSSPTFFGVEGLCSEAEDGDRSAMLALLLWVFLPNLEAIRLSRYTWDITFLKHAIESMSAQGLQQNSRASTPFTNLKRVYLCGSRGASWGENFEAFRWFAELPSMRKLDGDYVAGILRPEEEWKIPPHTSKVTHLRLIKSVVISECLEHLLLGIKSLESFAYEHNLEMTGGIGVEAHKILTALLRHAKHSLRKLRLYGGCDLREENERIDLRGFEVLKELWVNVGIYVELLPYHGDPSGRRDREDYQPLVSALPSSIEIVWFSNPTCFHHVAALFVDFAEKKDLCLPNLREVSFCCDRIGNDEDWALLREMCEQLGVTLGTYFDLLDRDGLGQ